ncbi:response regulator [Qipengyuania atrilutea]|uniref:Response regulator n=1 Tax=Qipengyuania atrilutea TaxID=2744473 RepID=A0A850H5Y9_9SPHN|nr:response regulator [Actirhodobacter atriluteus]NVD44565.1 response regulator [Actirhodobacter atriluteus]
MTEQLKILVVEDDYLVLLGTVSMLSSSGHTVLQATSGPEALGIMRETADIDVVLTDQKMPDMTGIELAELLHEQGSQVPVILVTGYSDIAEEEHPAIAACLVKPYSSKALNDVFARLFG